MENKTIQSVDRAFEVLEFISENGNKCRLQDISEGIGLKKSTVHSLIKTLENRGYLIRDEKSPKYSLGLNCMRLGIIYRRDFFAREKMHLFLVKLSEEIGETAFFTVKVGEQFFHLDAVAPDKSIKADPQVGAFKCIQSCCAISKVFLNYSTEYKASYELDFGNVEEEINCLAIPFKEKERLVGVIAFKGPAYRFNSEQIHRAYKLYQDLIINSNILSE